MPAPLRQPSKLGDAIRARNRDKDAQKLSDAASMALVNTSVRNQQSAQTALEYVENAVLKGNPALVARHDAEEEGPEGVYAACEAALGDSAELAARARSFREVPVSPYYDGPEAHRTAASALASAERIAAARRSRT